MNERNVKTLQELYDAVKSGAIPEATLQIRVDNDNTEFYDDPDWSAADEDDDALHEIEVEEANGYDDVIPLYRLLFPNAVVGGV